jgi:phosphoglycolate phosphatase
MERCDIAAAALAAAERHLNGHGGPRSENGAADRRLLVIGDTPHDISCGRSINALCVAVPTGNVPAATLRAAEPDVLVETLADANPILALLDD